MSTLSEIHGICAAVLKQQHNVDHVIYNDKLIFVCQYGSANLAVRHVVQFDQIRKVLCCRAFWPKIDYQRKNDLEMFATLCNNKIRVGVFEVLDCSLSFKTSTIIGGLTSPAVFVVTRSALNAAITTARIIAAPLAAAIMDLNESFTSIYDGYILPLCTASSTVEQRKYGTITSTVTISTSSNSHNIIPSATQNLSDSAQQNQIIQMQQQQQQLPIPIPLQLIENVEKEKERDKERDKEREREREKKRERKEREKKDHHEKEKQEDPFEELMKKITKIPKDQVKISGKIGSGGFAVVYGGEYLGTPIVIKQLKAMSRDMKSMLASELDVMSNLSHPNITQLIGAIESPFSLVMEYMTKGNLDELMKGEGKKFSKQRRFKLLRDASRGMTYLHSKRTIHGDLKPLNLFVDSDYRVKVGDFGLAVMKDAGDDLAVDDLSAFTPAFAAPEMFSRIATPASDIFAFASTIYFVMTLKLPFKGHNSREFKAAIRSGPRPKVSGFLPSQLATLVQKSWFVKQEQRPTFQEYTEVLNKLSAE